MQLPTEEQARAFQHEARYYRLAVTFVRGGHVMVWNRALNRVTVFPGKVHRGGQTRMQRTIARLKSLGARRVRVLDYVAYVIGNGGARTYERVFYTPGRGTGRSTRVNTPYPVDSDVEVRYMVGIRGRNG